MPQPLQPGFIRPQQIGQCEGRHHQIRFQHLDVEAQTHQHATGDQPAQLARFDGAKGGPRRRQQHQHQRGVDGVVAVRNHADGADCQRQRRNQSGDDAEMATHQPIEQRHRQHASQCLRQKDGERRKPKDLGAEHLQPEAQRWFVHCDETGGVQRNEEERVPVAPHALHGGGIILVAIPVLAELPEITENGKQRDSQQGQPVGNQQPAHPGCQGDWSYHLSENLYLDEVPV